MRAQRMKNCSLMAMPRKSKTSAWLVSLPIHLTYVKMSEAEERMLKERTLVALGLVQLEEADSMEHNQASTMEDLKDAA